MFQYVQSRSSVCGPVHTGSPGRGGAACSQAPAFCWEVTVPCVACARPPGLPWTCPTLPLGAHPAYMESVRAGAPHVNDLDRLFKGATPSTHLRAWLLTPVCRLPSPRLQGDRQAAIKATSCLAAASPVATLALPGRQNPLAPTPVVAQCSLGQGGGPVQLQGQGHALALWAQPGEEAGLVQSTLGWGTGQVLTTDMQHGL